MAEAPELSAPMQRLHGLRFLDLIELRGFTGEHLKWHESPTRRRTAAKPTRTLLPPPSESVSVSSHEIARNVVESQRLSTLIDYATATPFAMGFLETALAIEDSSNGIWRWPITLRNWRSATSNPEPTHRSI